MTQALYAQLAAEVLSREPIETRTRAIDRDAAIAGIAQAIVTRSQREGRRGRLARAGWTCAAAVVLAGAGWSAPNALWDSTARPAISCSAKTPCDRDRAPGLDMGRLNGRPFVPGQTVSSGPGERSVLDFPTGTRVALWENSHVGYELNPSTQRFRLARGALTLHVAKVGFKRRLVVETPDAEVEVHGTVFDVTVTPEPDSCARSRTRVSVEEGIVEIRTSDGRHQVAAGSSWPPACDAAPTLAERPEPETRARRTAGRRDLDPALAADEARAHLQRFPEGFGRREASELLQGPRP